MKKIKMLGPIQKKLISPDKFTGNRILVKNQNFLDQYEEDEWSLDLLKEGLETSASDRLDFFNGSDQFPGNLTSRRSIIPANGLTPTSLSFPFEYNYTYSDPKEENHSWIGQDSYGAKTYIDFKFSDDLNEDIYLTKTVLVEHDSELYLIGEKTEIFGGYKLNLVCVYRLQENNTWATEYKFLSYPIDTWIYEDVGPQERGVQAGSPCAVSYNGQLLVAFRQTDLNSGVTKIQVFRKNGKEYDLISSIDLEDTPEPTGKYTQYRLRMAAGGGQIMLVSYGIYTSSYDVRDMRTYLSNDEGYTFNSNSKSYKSIVRGLSSKYENTPAYFYMNDAFESEDDIVNCDVNFSLHFDNTNMCFCMFKGSDFNKTYLIGLMSSIRNPFMWDVVAKFPLDYNNCGIGSLVEYGTSTDPVSYDPLITTDGDYFSVEDTVAVTDGNNVFLLLSGSGLLSSGSILANIRIAHNSTIPKGYYNKVLALGQKIHKEYFFIADPFDATSTGLMHSGNLMAFPNFINGGPKWKDTIGTIWRNQIVIAGKLTERDPEVPSVVRDRYIEIYDRYKFLAIAGQLNNIAEEYPYELSYPARLGDPHMVFDEVLTSGSYSYDEDKNLLIFTNSSSPECYLIEHAGFAIPTIAQRASTSALPLVKTRFQVEVGGISGIDELEVFRWIVFSKITDTTSVVGIRCHVKGDGAVIFRNQNGSASPVVAYIDLETKYDFAIIADRVTGPRLTFAYKKAEEEYWNVALVDLDFTVYYSGPLTDDVRIGCCSSSTASATAYVGIGDVHLSNFGQKYFPKLVSNRLSSIGRNAEYIASARANNVSPRCRPIQSYGDTLVLRDGTRISVRGHIGDLQTYSSFDLEGARNENHITNVMIPNTSLFYNFSSLVGLEDAEDIVFENTNMSRFDSVAMIFGVGVQTVQIKSGYYDIDTDSWSSLVSETFNWPTTKITPVDSFDNIILSDVEYQTHELSGRYLWVYDTVLGYCIQQIKIIDNEENLITLAEAPNLNSVREIHIPETSAVFTFDKRPPSQHIMVSMLGVPNGNKAISVIEIGTIKTLEDAVSEAKFEISSTDDIQTSDRNFSFNLESDESQLSKSIDVSMPNLVLNSTYFNRIRSMIQKIKDNNQSFVLIEIDYDESMIVNYGPITELSFAPNGNEIDINFKYMSTTFKDTSVNYEAFTPSAKILCSEGNIITGKPFTLSIMSSYAEDEDLSYSWHIDGVYIDSTPTITTSISSLGQHEVTVEILDSNGTITTLSMYLFVSTRYITNYTATASPSSPYTIYFVARGDDGFIVEDNDMYLTIIRLEPNPITVSNPTVDLTNGLGTTTISYTGPSGPMKIYFVDSEGKNSKVEVNLT